MSGPVTTASPAAFSNADSFVRDDLVLDDEFAIDPEGTTFAPTPVYARTGKRKTSRAPSKIALFAIPVILVGAGAAFMLMSQPRNDLMAESSPAIPPASTAGAPGNATSAAPPAAAPDAADTAQAAPLPVNSTPDQRASASIPAATKAAPRRTQPTRVARARPAESAASASGVGADASATLPAAPAPYSATTSAAPVLTPTAPAVQPSAPAPATTAPVDPDPMARGPAVP